jgi:hypothetical protein
MTAAFTTRPAAWENFAIPSDCAGRLHPPNVNRDFVALSISSPHS